jgi:hypothetical protein
MTELLRVQIFNNSNLDLFHEIIKKSLEFGFWDLEFVVIDGYC